MSVAPGSRGPKPVDSTDSIAAAEAALAAKYGPDVEEVDDGDEIDTSDATPAPAAAAPAPKAGPAGEQPAAPLDQPAAPAPAPAAAAAPAAAPAAAAPAADDPWAETEDVEYEDVDTGDKYVVRSPKKYAERIRQGYQSRSYTDRKLSSYGRNRQWIEPLIANGSFDKLAPHLQTIFNDQELQRGMAELINRKAAGLPLRFAEQAAAEAAAAGAAARQPAPAAAPAVAFDENAERVRLRGLGYDDYTIDATINAVKPIAESYGQRFTTLEQQLNGFSEQQKAQARQAQAQQQERQRMIQIGAAARAQLLSWYPNELTENTPPAMWNSIEAYARNSGLIDALGFTAGAFTTAYQRMRETGMVQVPGQTLAPSAAVAAVADVEAQARAAAAQVAQQQRPPNGTGAAPAQVAPRAQPAPRFRELANGKKVPLTPTEIAAEMAKRPRQPATV